MTAVSLRLTAGIIPKLRRIPMVFLQSNGEVLQPSVYILQSFVEILQSSGEILQSGREVCSQEMMCGFEDMSLKIWV